MMPTIWYRFPFSHILLLTLFSWPSKIKMHLFVSLRCTGINKEDIGMLFFCYALFLTELISLTFTETWSVFDHCSATSILSWYCVKLKIKLLCASTTESTADGFCYLYH